MFLNETKPPLDEVVEHFGILGMHWGVRKSSGSYNPRSTPQESYDTSYLNELNPEKKKHTGLKIAGLILAGAATSAIILQKNGQFKAGALQQKQGYEAVGNAFKKIHNHSFRPETVGNPLWKAGPKAASSVFTPQAAIWAAKGEAHMKNNFSGLWETSLPGGSLHKQLRGG